MLECELMVVLWVLRSRVICQGQVLHIPRRRSSGDPRMQDHRQKQGSERFLAEVLPTRAGHHHVARPPARHQSSLNTGAPGAGVHFHAVLWKWGLAGLCQGPRCHQGAAGQSLVQADVLWPLLPALEEYSTQGSQMWKCSTYKVNLLYLHISMSWA